MVELRGAIKSAVNRTFTSETKRVAHLVSQLGRREADLVAALCAATVKYEKARDLKAECALLLVYLECSRAKIAQNILEFHTPEALRQDFRSFAIAFGDRVPGSVF